MYYFWKNLFSANIELATALIFRPKKKTVLILFLIFNICIVDNGFRKWNLGFGEKCVMSGWVCVKKSQWQNGKYYEKLMIFRTLTDYICSLFCFNGPSRQQNIFGTEEACFGHFVLLGPWPIFLSSCYRIHGT